MSYAFRHKLAQTISKYIKPNHDINPETILPKIWSQTNTDNCELSFIYSVNLVEVPDLKNIVSFKNDTIRDIQLTEKGINFSIDSNKYLQHVLNYDLQNNKLRSFKKPLKTVIDFSSPNIAKPFHFGHLRSTIVGNFISNISKYLGDEVVKINYLGDWGVQFGLLKYGLDECNINVDKLNENPLKALYEVYVTANNLVEKQPEVEEIAKEIFRQMEFAEEENEDLRKWMTIREQTINEISRIYSRLGVQFDEYNWESDYSAKRIETLVKQLVEKNIIVEEDGALVAKMNYNVSVPFLKNDGTTLYLSRDFAAVLDRYERHNFDKMLYVVDSSQAKHFKILIDLVDQLDPECAAKLEHVMFGRVLGISTRKGTAVFLDDILNEIREKMERIRMQAITTKGELGGEISDILGMSALIVNDLKKRKNSNYQFDYDVVLKSEGNSGNKLQYCHCRLFSIEENSGIKLPRECDVSVLREPEAVKLITEISRFDEAIMNSYSNLEACILLRYLFNLCDAINKAHKVLRVKGESEHLASQRLLMFHKARITLNTGMKIIGLKPLNQM